MAGMKEIWAEAKRDMKKNNDKFADDMRKNSERTKSESKQAVESYKSEVANTKPPKWEKSNRGFTKTALMVWLLVLLIPLGLFGVYLLWVAGLLVWDMIFGL